MFAQGPHVEVGELTSGGIVIERSSLAAVSWVDNPKSELEAVPNKDLTGMLATFTNIPAGDATVEISGAHVVDFFYKPRVSFGIVLRDSNGTVVDVDRIVGGDYTVEFGFMDRDCNFVQSDLLGDVTYSAQALQNGVTNSDVAPFAYDAAYPGEAWAVPQRLRADLAHAWVPHANGLPCRRASGLACCTQ